MAADTLPLIRFFQVVEQLGDKYRRSIEDSGGRPLTWTESDQERLGAALKSLIKTTSEIRKESEEEAQTTVATMKSKREPLTKVIETGSSSLSESELAVATFRGEQKEAVREVPYSPYTSLTKRPDLKPSTISQLYTKLQQLASEGFVATSERGSSFLENTVAFRERTYRDMGTGSDWEPALAQLGASLLALNASAALRPQSETTDRISVDAMRASEAGWELDKAAYAALGMLAAGVPFGETSPVVDQTSRDATRALEDAVRRGQSILDTQRQSNPGVFEASDRLRKAREKRQLEGGFPEPIKRLVRADRSRKTAQIAGAVFRFGTIVSSTSSIPSQAQKAYSYMESMGFSDFLVFLDDGYEEALEQLQEALLLQREGRAVQVSSLTDRKLGILRAELKEIQSLAKDLFDKSDLPAVYDRNTGAVRRVYLEYFQKERTSRSDQRRLLDYFEQRRDRAKEIKDTINRFKEGSQISLGERSSRNIERAREDAEHLARYYVAVNLWDLVFTTYYSLGDRFEYVVLKLSDLLRAGYIQEGKSVTPQEALVTTNKLLFADEKFKEKVNKHFAFQYGLWLDSRGQTGLPFTGYEQIKYLAAALGLDSLVSSVTGNVQAFTLAVGRRVSEAGLPEGLIGLGSDQALRKAFGLKQKELMGLNQLRRKSIEEDLTLIDASIQAIREGDLDVEDLRQSILRRRRMTAEDFDRKITPLTRELVDSLETAADITVTAAEEPKTRMLSDEADRIARDVYNFNCNEVGEGYRYALQAPFSQEFFEEVFQWLNYTSPVTSGFSGRTPNPSTADISLVNNLQRALRVQRGRGKDVMIPVLPYAQKLWFKGLDRTTRSRLQQNVISRRDEYMNLIRPGGGASRLLQTAHPWLYNGESFNYWVLTQIALQIGDLYGEFSDAEEDAFDEEKYLVLYQMFNNTGVENLLFDRLDRLVGYAVDAKGTTVEVPVRSEEEGRRVLEETILMNPAIMEILLTPDSATSYFLASEITVLPTVSSNEQRSAALAALSRLAKELGVKGVRAKVREDVTNFGPPTALARDIYEAVFCYDGDDQAVVVPLSAAGASEAFNFLVAPDTARFIRANAEDEEQRREWMDEARVTAAYIASELANLRGKREEYGTGLTTAGRRELMEYLT